MNSATRHADDSATTPAQAIEPQARTSTVGVFDSGVGGLSIVRALRTLLPGLPMVYVADSGHAPYGDRDDGHVLRRTQLVVDHLVAQGAELVVMACNTATAWAIEAMRSRHPGTQFVGVEPGVKPAAAVSANRRFAVMATPATLASRRFASLVATHASDCLVHPVACAGLAAAIERGEEGRDEVLSLLDRYCLPLRDYGLDTVVLGCTHYPFVADEIAMRVGPHIALLDTASAIARRVCELLAANGRLVTTMESRTPGELTLYSTGDAQLLAHMAKSRLGSPGPAIRISI